MVNAQFISSFHGKSLSLPQINADIKAWTSKQDTKLPLL